MKKCIECEYFKIRDIPDEMNEGHAICEKYNLIVDLVGHYKQKVKRLTCEVTKEKC